MEGTAQSGQFDLGHWVLRLIAWIIDSIILGIIAFIITLVLLVPFLFVDTLAGFYAFWGYAFIIPLIIGLLSVLYFLVLEVSWGATIGKRILGLRVQTVSGARITYSQSFIRNISKIFWLFLLLDWLVGVVTQGDRRQKYSDRMAGVVVVQISQPLASVSPPPPPPPPSPVS